eukprot:552230-Hanusia_phi.AAC.1
MLLGVAPHPRDPVQFHYGGDQPESDVGDVHTRPGPAGPGRGNCAARLSLGASRHRPVTLSTVINASAPQEYSVDVEGGPAKLEHNLANLN